MATFSRKKTGPPSHSSTDRSKASAPTASSSAPPSWDRAQASRSSALSSSAENAGRHLSVSRGAAGVEGKPRVDAVWYPHLSVAAVALDLHRAISSGDTFEVPLGGVRVSPSYTYDDGGDTP